MKPSTLFRAGSARLLLGCVCLLASAGVAFGQSASDELCAGETEVKAAHYEAAIQHFKRALDLDPNLTEARFDLAQTYASLYIPGNESRENVDLAERAITEFELILRRDPSREMKLAVLKQLASLNFSMKKFDTAADYYKQIGALDDKDAEAYYSLGVIDWMQAYKADQELREQMGLRPTDEMLSSTGCNQLLQSNQEKIEDGIENLRKALEIRPDYDDAMAYMNLLYRQKAEYECDDPAVREADLKAADEWVDRTMETKKMKAERGRTQH